MRIGNIIVTGIQTSKDSATKRILLLCLKHHESTAKGVMRLIFDVGKPFK